MFNLPALFLLLSITPVCLGFWTAIFGPNGFLGRRNFAFDRRNGLLGDVCQRGSCVNYTVISSGQGFERRRYEQMTVAVTSTSSSFMGKLSLRSRLNRYTRHGNNEAGERVQTAYPVLTPISPAPPNPSLQTMMFILRDEAPPSPNNTLVGLEVLPAMEVFVRPYHGNSFRNSFEAEVRDFKTALGLQEAVTPSDVAYIAEYGPMFSVFGRKSELWLVASYPARDATIMAYPDGFFQNPADLPGII